MGLSCEQEGSAKRPQGLKPKSPRNPYAARSTSLRAGRSSAALARDCRPAIFDAARYAAPLADSFR